MSYPMKEVRSGSCSFYREMTATEYEEALEFYRKKTAVYLKDTSPRCKSYGLYLRRWFSEAPCDGVSSYSERVKFHKLPQTANGYMFE